MKAARNIRTFAVQQSEELLGKLTAQIARTMESAGMDDVHDLRVAIRRFRRILHILKPCFPRAESKRIRHDLKRLMIHAGQVRDLDIAMRLATKVASAEPNPFEGQLQHWRDKAAQTLIESLRRWSERKRAGAWQTALKSEPVQSTGSSIRADTRFCTTPAIAAAKRILPRMAKEHFRRGEEAAGRRVPAKELHKFRIAAKNLRYTLDVFAPLYGDSLTALSEQLKDTQTLLGDINDCAAAQRLLAHEKVAHRQSANRILSRLKKRQAKKIKKFRHAAEEFSNSATLRKWTSTLRAPRTAGRGGPTGKPRPS